MGGEVALPAQELAQWVQGLGTWVDEIVLESWPAPQEHKEERGMRATTFKNKHKPQSLSE